MTDTVKPISTTTGFDPSGDGYDYLQNLEATGKWVALGSWGLDGWDLGDWPYVVYLISRTEDGVAVRERCEGDLTTWTFPTPAEAFAYIDSIWHGQVQRDPSRFGFEAVPDDLDTNPRFRGPFTWARLNASQASTAEVAR